MYRARFAADKGHVKVITMLLGAGAAIEQRDSEDWTALIYASFSNHPEAARRLLKAGASTSSVNNKGYTASEIAREQGHITNGWFYDGGQLASVFAAAKTAAEYRQESALEGKQIDYIGQAQFQAAQQHTTQQEPQREF